MSGGVDSSVAAVKLMQAGFEVSGVVFKMSPLHQKAVDEAKECCLSLGIPLTVKDLSSDFERLIVSDFCKRFSSGITPNPCVICNPLVKFHALAQTADELGIQSIATGHYANTDFISGIPVITKAASLERDQSYMLYRLPEDIIARLIFPLGNIGKDEVRAVAREISLSSADAPDSQEICFIEGKDYPTYIHERGYFGKKGCFILPDGRRIPHRGVEYYTVGQRKGLGISYPQPLFVREIQQNGDIALTVSGGEFASAIRVSDVVLSKAFGCFDSLTVKVRSMAKNADCTVIPCNGGLLCRFDTPQRAPAPGQSAVFYGGDAVIGGGLIAETFVENPPTL